MRDVPLNVAQALDTDPSKDLYCPVHEGAVRFFNHDPPFILDARVWAGIGPYRSLIYATVGFSSQYAVDHLGGAAAVREPRQ